MLASHRQADIERTFAELDAESARLDEEGQTDAAVTASERLLEYAREHFAHDHYWIVVALERIATLHLNADENDLATGYFDEAARLCETLGEEERALINDVRTSLAYCRRLQARPDLARAESLAVQELNDCLDAESPDESLEAANRLLEIRRDLIGNKHPLFAGTLSDAAQAAMLADDLESAETQLRQASEIYLEHFGADSDEYLNALELLRNLAWEHFAILSDEERWPDARRLVEQTIQLEERIYGHLSEDVDRSLSVLSNLCMQVDDPPASRGVLERQLALREEALGSEHWRTIDCRVAIMTHDEWQGLSTEQRREIHRAETLYEEACRLQQKSKSREAEAPAEDAWLIYRELLGEASPTAAFSLNALGLIYTSLGKFDQAGELLQLAVKHATRWYGERHPIVASVLDNQAQLFTAQGKYQQAVELFERAAEVQGETLGDRDLQTVTSLHNLGVAHAALGSFKRANLLLTQVVEILQLEVGEEDPQFAKSLCSLAGLRRDVGEYEEARTLYEQAAAIQSSLFPDHQTDYADTLVNLCTVFQAMGDWPKAVPKCIRAGQIYRSELGEEHSNYGASIARLADLYMRQGSLMEAAELYREAYDVQRAVLPEGHPSLAALRNNAGQILTRVGCYDEAEELLQESLDATRNAFGERHAATATLLNNLGGLRYYQGRYAEAIAEYERALDIRIELESQHVDSAITRFNIAEAQHASGAHSDARESYHEAWKTARAHLELLAEGQSHREQMLAMEELQSMLEGIISLTPEQGAATERAYAEVLAWKGVVFRRHLLTRLVADDAELKPLFEQHCEVATEIANLTFSGSQHLDAEARKALGRLTSRRERLQAQMAKRSSAFRQIYDGATPESLRDSLPADAVLVDLVVYQRRSEPDGNSGVLKTELHLAAFVTAKDRPIRKRDLGRFEPLKDLVRKWLLSIDADGDGGAAGQQLRARLWEPLVGDFPSGATVLVSPDRELGRLSWPALPGAQPGSYLIEEWPLAVAPVPQLLPLILSPAKAPPTILLVGNPDYGTPTSEGLVFPALRHAGPEVRSIASLFRDRFPNSECRRLEGAAATESAFRREAPLSSHLHLATHGFFRPPSLVSTIRPLDRPRMIRRLYRGLHLSALHPGLLSGLALAGANRREGDFDGILSSLEVASLDLTRADMVVLSACQTGVGEVTSGEGMAGLQRAFQIAGARTVVASLWSVPDEETRFIMERFYELLWDEDEEQPLTRVQALRAAQIALLYGDEAPRDPTPGYEKTPPRYWAAFVISGDWQ